MYCFSYRTSSEGSQFPSDVDRVGDPGGYFQELNHSRFFLLCDLSQLYLLPFGLFFLEAETSDLENACKEL